METNLVKWGKISFPKWVTDLKYTSLTLWSKLVANMIPVKSYDKSSNESPFEIVVGGCTQERSSEWAHPNQAPPQILRGQYAYKKST